MKEGCLFLNGTIKKNRFLPGTPGDTFIMCIIERNIANFIVLVSNGLEWNNLYLESFNPEYKFIKKKILNNIFNNYDDIIEGYNQISNIIKNLKGSKIIYSYKKKRYERND